MDGIISKGEKGDIVIPIGIVSDGLEGLPLLRCLAERMPGRRIFFHGDTLRAPVGIRSRDAVIMSAEQGGRLLRKKGAGIILLSDALAAASPHLESMAGMPPVFTAVQAAAEMAAEKSRRGLVAVLGAPALVDSGLYQTALRALRPAIRVSHVSMPLAEPLVREGRLNRPETRVIIKKYLHRLKLRQTDLLICAHGWAVPLLPLIREKIGKRALVLDAAGILADRICRDLCSGETAVDGGAEWNPPAADTGTSPRIRCEVTDIGPLDAETARRLFGRPLRLRGTAPINERKTGK